MRHVLAAALLLQALCLASVSYSQQPATQPAPAARPDPDVEIQAAYRVWMSGGANAPVSQEEYLRGFARLMDLKQRKQVSNDQWLKQTYLYLVSEKPGGAWPMDVFLAKHWQNYFQIAPDEFVAALAPYITTPNEQSSAYAMIGGAGAFELTILSNPSNPPHPRVGFRNIEKYLRKLNGQDPSWWVLLAAYHSHADAALETAAPIYLDRQTLQVLQRTQKELALMLISADLATEAERLDWHRKALAKLEELSKNPHWSVRAYAVQKASDARLPGYLELVNSMQQDQNYLVSSMAKEIVSSSVRRR